MTVNGFQETSFAARLCDAVSLDSLVYMSLLAGQMKRGS
jgi:hypothetical protein